MNEDEQIQLAQYERGQRLLHEAEEQAEAEYYYAEQTKAYIAELEAENERLRDLSDDTKRLEFIIKNYMRVYSLDMSGKHTWSGVGRPIGKGTTPREAIDAAREVEK